MSQTISSTDARSRWAEIFRAAVVEHRPTAIERGTGDVALLVGVDEIKQLLSEWHFQPEAFFEKDAVSLWLPEFALYGRGPSFDEARSDLVDEVRAYVDEYLADARLYLRSPNRAAHFPHVLKAFVADAEGRLEDALFAPPPAEAGAAT